MFFSATTSDPETFIELTTYSNGDAMECGKRQRQRSVAQHFIKFIINYIRRESAIVSFSFTLIYDHRSFDIRQAGWMCEKLSKVMSLR